MSRTYSYEMVDESITKSKVNLISQIPKAVPFILCSIFFERFTSGGIAASLALFFNKKLGFDPNISTALFHTYECLAMSLTIVGAIVADNWFGLFRTVASMSMVYGVGITLLSIGNVEPLGLSLPVMTLIGMLILTVGHGFIKSNSNTFAANQYKLPEQAQQFSFYFSLQYFCMKSGSIIGRFITPVVRSDVKCFGMNDCFPLAFGVHAISMFLSSIILIIGKRYYAKEILKGNMFVRVCACITNAIKEKLKQRDADPKDHWLDYAEDKHGVKLVNDTKMAFNVMLMFVPVPVFWTLIMQQGSRWVFQATRMNGDIGFYTIKPDQMIVFNSIFSLLLVPVFERIFYPLMAKFGIKTPLQKMACGLFCAAASFVIAALVEIQINRNFIHILWLVPQYFVMVMGEIMLLIQSLNFAYNEAPSNMKSVMLSCVYLCMAVGNAFMIIISGTRIFESQTVEFLFFSGIMLLDMIFFILLAVKYKYVELLRTPRSVPFILCNIFLERFSSAGVTALLALFLNRKLNFDQNASTALYHTYDFLNYFLTIFGAIVAESWLGLFKTLSLMNFVYAFGSAIVSLSGIESIGLPLKSFSIIGLLTILIAAGGLKSNLNAFGGNQFKLPEQATQLGTFFSLQYFSLKCGASLARITFPILREDVKCFQMTDCYPLAFALPCFAMLLAFIILICGKRSYIKESDNGSMFVKVIGCVFTGIKQKPQKTEISTDDDHWLDRSVEKYGTKLVMETKIVLNVLVMFIPLPLFWALHSQQGSRWVFQAAKMNGDIGFYTIKPDQMILFNSLLGVLMIPVFEYLFYPLMSRFGINTPLRKIVLGGMFASFSFVVAAVVEIQIETNFINILWMLPQYLVMVMGEILVYTSVLNFSYTEAPANMKSVMMSFMMLTVAGGSLIVIVISGIAFFDSQIYEYLFFAGVLFLDIILFAFLATRYKYVNQTPQENGIVCEMSQKSDVVLESGKNGENLPGAKFPKSTYFILINIFFERVSSGGLFAIMAIFINEKLKFDSSISTALFHVNEFTLYFFTIIGAIVAESWLGLYRMIAWMSFMFTCGTCVIAIVSIDSLQLPIKSLSLTALLLVVLASGANKSNQNVFGGNQFKLPEEQKQLDAYFSIQYFVMKCGMLVGQISVPILRNDVKCLGMNDCYPLAFGTSSVLMFISFLVICFGKSFYVHVPPRKNMFLRVCSCILNATKHKLSSFRISIPPKDHWLDYAEEEKYDAKLVSDTKLVLSVLTLFLPLPIFWSLYSQLNSNFVFQASQMDGNLMWYTLKPDQMITLTTIFIIILIPVFDQLVYPLLAKISIKTPLQKMTCGFICVGLSFIVAAMIEWKLQQGKLHMLWLIPQYLLTSMAEIFLWVANISFVYTQAPDNMKSVMTAFVYLTIAGGDLIIITISGSNFIKSQFYEFLFYAMLMFINTMLFIVLSRRYRFVEKNEEVQKADAEEIKSDEMSEIKSPVAVRFIFCFLLLERFCSGGMTALLALYLYLKLNLDTSIATSVFHIHEFLAYSFTILAAIAADSWIGHFKTILYLSFFYTFGSLTLALGNIEPLNLSIALFTIIGLAPMVLGAGSIRISLNVLGANQYKLPEQASQLSFYFTLQYVFIKTGSILGRLILPILGKDVKCFEMDDCYPLSFGAVAVAMLTGVICLLCGNGRYVKQPPEGNMMIEASKCIGTAIIGKFKSKISKLPSKNHWLDYAEEKFGSKVVAETKIVVNILILYIPLPIYWAIYVQQASRWVFQATRMDGNIGFYTINADQMIVFNSLLGVLMVPVCDYILYPLLAKVKLKTYLQKMTVGGFIAVAAFAVSAFMEIIIEKNFIHILWLLPQYLLLALSENFLYIANVSFAYSEAPQNMKSVMQAFIFLTIAFGNLIVALISGTKIFESPALELFFFSGTLFVNQIIFGILAYKYKYVNGKST
ncbi:CLUMA_CG014953, isoform A [Clunio marinus]|uniref:Oligopeptide transporter 1 n=1 Tax=Clunio marinus TaxID=568069 RepID=A0A1J1ITA3_9DIPT|nr:CLUMA_CG014953, isoform A [Clunio marinus]